MKKTLMLAFILTSGCTTAVPSVRHFPAPPVDLVYPADLDTLQPGSKLSDLLDCVNRNNEKYHEASVKLRSWIDWYKEQKTLDYR